MEAAVLERFLSPGKGSGLRARRQVRPGELLYCAEPFAYVVTKEQLGSVCERCLRRNEMLQDSEGSLYATGGMKMNLKCLDVEV